MDLSRDSIERSDFPRAADGLDPEAVQAHLREVAAAVAKLTRSVRRLAAEIEERAGAVETAMERKPAPPPPKAEPEPEPAPEPAPQPEPAAPAGGGDAPRLIALNMVLDGASREDVARYLDENFELENPAALLDEVWARAGKTRS